MHGLGRVYRTGGIVRGVYENGARPRRDRLGQPLDVRREVAAFRRHSLQHAAEVAAVAGIFHEIRRRAHHLVARLDHSAEERHECASRTDRHHNMARTALGGGAVKPLLAVYVVRHGLAHRRNAAIWAVAKAERLDGVGGDLLQGGLCCRRRRHVWIAERKVAHGIRAIFRLEFKPLFEHLANPR